MRKVLSAVLATALLTGAMTVGGCGGTGNKTMWFEPPTKKVTARDPAGRTTKYTVYLAKNEYEGLQVVFRCPETRRDVELELSPLRNEAGDVISAELYQEYTVGTVKAEPFFQPGCEDFGIYRDYPDALAPLTEPVTLPKETAKAFYILVHTEEDTPAGDYTASVTAKCGGLVLEELSFTAHVWDFAMPQGRTMETAMSLGDYQIYRMYPQDYTNDQLKALYVQYYDFLLEHNVCAYRLPYDILDERVDAYLDDPRVTTFTIPYAGDDDVIRAYYAKLSQKPEWLAKGVFYPLDEPGTPDAYRQLHEMGERLAELYPGYRLVSPFFQNPDMGEGKDAIDYASEVMNVWCPKLFCFDDSKLYSEEQKKTKDSFASRMKKEKEGGDALWWYVCWEPGEPYANLYVNMQGVVNRSIFWQAYRYGVNGFLYWSVNYWNRLENPWTDMRTVSDLSPDVFGDGSLLYNGNYVGVDGACSSLRLEAVRDGVDDYELMVMAREAGMSERQLNRIVKKVAKTVTDYSLDDETMMEARIKLAKYIEKAAKKK